jgi:hypothetical protein
METWQLLQVIFFKPEIGANTNSGQVNQLLHIAMSGSGEEAGLYFQSDVPLNRLTKKDGSMRCRCCYMYRSGAKY